MNFARVFVCSIFYASLFASIVGAQSTPSQSTPPQSNSENRRRLPIPELTQPGCPVASLPETSPDDALPSLCLPSSLMEAGKLASPPLLLAAIPLHLPAGTPLRIALDQKVRVNKPGAPVRGKVLEPVYVFDQIVIPAGSIATGQVKSIAPVPRLQRTLAYANGDFTPFHRYEITFDAVTLPDGKQLPIQTTVSPGTADVVRLVSNPEKEKQKGAVASAADKAKAETKGRIHEAKAQAREGWHTLTAPGKMHRLKTFLLAQLLAQSPYRRQYLEPGTRFVADLDAPLDFGAASRTATQLANMGSEPPPDSTLKARLVAEVSSATATRGTSVTAVLTEPLYSPAHQLILPANSRLVGEVVAAKPARKLHHNGDLRMVFERIETSDEGVQALAQLETQVQEQDLAEIHRANSQAMVGNLEGVEVARSANMKLDEEGGAHTTDSKTRYLSTGLAVMLAAAASHTEVERGATETAGPGVRTAAGGSGFRLTGAIMSLAAHSMPVSLAFGVYGASTSIYAHFLSRGQDVVLPKDTLMEIGFGPPHPAPPPPKPQ